MEIKCGWYGTSLCILGAPGEPVNSGMCRLLLLAYVVLLSPVFWFREISKHLIHSLWLLPEPQQKALEVVCWLVWEASLQFLLLSQLLHLEVQVTWKPYKLNTNDIPPITLISTLATSITQPLPYTLHMVRWLLVCLPRRGWSWTLGCVRIT